MTAFERFVSGRPAPFATAGERPWKDALAAQLRTATPDRAAGFIELDFAVAPAVGYARGADLDNFCEPVFSVVANRIGWFGGSRPNIRAFRARKRLADETGCRILITANRWDGTWVDGIELLNDVAPGLLPMSARDEPFAGWVAGTMVRPAGLTKDVGVELRFPGPINLGDIATGRIKNIIDCLYPVLGGAPGKPNDARVTVLEATKLDHRVTGAVHVRVVEVAPHG